MSARESTTRPRHYLVPFGLAMTVLFTGCSGLAPHPRSTSSDPDVRLHALLEQLERARPSLALRDAEEVVMDSGRLRVEIERLTLEFPAHRSSLLASAQLAYEPGESEKAAVYLDRVRRLGDRDGSASVLRARIALEEGAVGVARRMIEDQLQRTPDASGLYEVLAAVHFANADLDACAVALSSAESLGADPARVAYLRGLVADQRGDRSAARSAYERALALDAGFDAASARLSRPAE